MVKTNKTSIEPLSVMGVDPGLQSTSVSIIYGTNHDVNIQYVEDIRIPKWESYKNLKFIYDSIKNILNYYNPDVCAIEKPIHGINPEVSLKLGRAQAAAMLAIYDKDITIYEYLPKIVKQAITGNGNASKASMAKMIYDIFKLDTKGYSDHVTDAISIAWCHIIKISTPMAIRSIHRKKHKGKEWLLYTQSNPSRVV